MLVVVATPRTSLDPHVTSRAVLDHAHDPIIAVSLADTVIEWNPAAQRVFGWSRDEVIGRPLPTLPDAAAAAQRQAAHQRVRAGELVSLPTRRQCRDGTALDVLINYSPLRDPTGELVGYLGVVHDMTREYSRQRELEERAHLVGRLVEVVADLTADLDRDAVLDRICSAGLELFDCQAAGYVLLEGDELVVVAAKGLTEGIIGVRYPLAGSGVSRALRDRRMSLRGLTANYRNPGPPQLTALMDKLPVLAVGLTAGQARPTGALYVMFRSLDRRVTDNELDVLELLAAQASAAVANAASYAEVVRQREHEQAVFAAMADGMAVVGGDGAVRGWNPSAEAMTGLSAEQVLGGRLPFPMPPPGEQADYRLPNGRWLEVLCNEIEDADELVVDFRDITDPKELEEAKDLFLATTSHELRTPITVLKGFAGTLLHRWEQLTDAERRESVGVILNRTEALAGLVEQLLLGSRAGVGEVEAQPTRLDPGPALRRAALGFEALSQRHTLRLELPAELPEVLVDPVTLDAVVGQLLENAIKYSPGRGEVVITAAAGEGGVVVGVRDHGIGVDPGEADRLFERFYQGAEGDRRRFGGVGLGLFIVRRLLETQGGTVRASAAEGGGTLVEFSLPLAP